MLESIKEITELFIISVALYLIYKLLNEDSEKFTNQVNPEQKKLFQNIKLLI